MAYKEMGSFDSSRPVTFETAQYQRKPWTFFEKVTFQGATRQIIIEDGTIKGFVISGDIVSENWDGASTLALPDATATLGYALDVSEGEAQFQSIYARGGTLDDLTVTGTLLMDTNGEIQTSPTAPYIRIAGGPAAESMQFVTGVTDDINTSGLNFGQTTPTAYLNFIGPAIEPASAGNYGWGDIQLTSWKDGSIGVTSVTASGVGTADAKVNVTADAQGSGDGMLDLIAMSTSGASQVQIQGDVIKHYADSIVFTLGGTQVYTFTAGSKAEFQIDNGGTKFDGVLRITQEAGGGSIIGFYNSAWQTYMTISEDEFQWATAATRRMSLSTANLIVGNIATGNAMMPFAAGTVGNPAYTFYADSDTGVYRIAANYMGLAAGGNLIAQFGYSSPNKEIYFYGVPSTGSYNTLRYNTSTGRIYYLTSGRKYKDHITDADLADVELRPRRYWRNDDEAWQYGFIADEIEAEVPEAITQRDEDGEADNYDDRAVLAVLAAKINRLEALTSNCTCGKMRKNPEEL